MLVHNWLHCIVVVVIGTSNDSSKRNNCRNSYNLNGRTKSVTEHPIHSLLSTTEKVEKTLWVVFSLVWVVSKVLWFYMCIKGTFNAVIEEEVFYLHHHNCGSSTWYM